jgi:hypothetical protein
VDAEAHWGFGAVGLLKVAVEDTGVDPLMA